MVGGYHFRRLPVSDKTGHAEACVCLSRVVADIQIGSWVSLGFLFDFSWVCQGCRACYSVCFLLSDAKRGAKGHYREPAPELTLEKFIASVLARAKALQNVASPLSWFFYVGAGLLPGIDAKNSST
jgi:hypothetical protein